MIEHAPGASDAGLVPPPPVLGMPGLPEKKAAEGNIPGGRVAEGAIPRSIYLYYPCISLSLSLSVYIYTISLSLSLSLYIYIYIYMPT